MKLVRLRAFNVKALRDLEIAPDGNLIVVAGRNMQGKSSLLDCVQMLFGGKAGRPDQPLRRGEPEGFTEAETDSGLIVRLDLKGEQQKLTVRQGRDQKPLASPQAILDAMVGELTFDPLAFMALSPREQLASLRKLVGVDTSDIEAQIVETERERTSEKVRLDVTQSNMVTLGEPEIIPGLPDEEISVQPLLDESQRLQAYDESVRQRQQALANRGEEVAAAESRVVTLREQLNDALQHLSERRAAALASQDRLIELQKEKPPRGQAHINNEIAVFEGTNARIRHRQQWTALTNRERAQKALISDYNAVVARLRAAALARVAAAKFPVPGLGFGQDGITFNGLPFEQASGREQLIVSLGMGIALNPMLKVMLIRDGDKIDADGLKLLAEMVNDADFQVLLEVVRPDDSIEPTVVIEDGMAVAR